MKILHIITSLRTGGAEHLMVDLLPRLRGLGNEVELLIFDGTRTPFYAQLESTGIPIHTLGIGGNVYHPRNLWRLTKFLHKHHYDIVHTHNTACQLFAPMARIMMRGGFRLFTTEHSANNRRRGKWWLKIIDRWMYARYERVICISEQPRMNLLNYIGKQKNICTIFNGINVAQFNHPIKDISHNSQFIISMVASLSAAKDQDTLIRAMTLLPKQFHLQLVGDGPRRPLLEELATKQGVADRVTFLGIRTDIPEIMEASDIMVLSSHWEGLSLSSIEGMASGRPFVASDVDGLREVVDGYGMLFPEGDAQALASTVLRLYENPKHYRQVAQQCQQRAQQFDIAIMAQKYNELYSSH